MTPQQLPATWAQAVAQLWAELERLEAEVKALRAAQFRAPEPRVSVDARRHIHIG